jgi:hypothetical protein
VKRVGNAAVGIASQAVTKEPESGSITRGEEQSTGSEQAGRAIQHCNSPQCEPQTYCELSAATGSADQDRPADRDTST